MNHVPKPGESTPRVEVVYFTCEICGKEAEADGFVDLPYLGRVWCEPRGWWGRNTEKYGHQAACSEEHARELMRRDR
jgi:hypothetical protein